MYFLATEYTTTFGGRIDTLAVDLNGCPVIIEYKKNRNDNVINQALSYLKWLQAQKVEFFEMLVQKELGNKIASKLKIDWKNPRVICIAESYSKFDIDTIDIIPIRIELFRYRFYDGGVFSLEPLSESEHKATKISPRSITRTTIDFSVTNHLKKASSKARNLFELIRSGIFALDENIKEKATAVYIAYRVTRNFAEIYIQKDCLVVIMRPIRYDDPRKIVEKISDGYNWTLNKRVYLKSENDITYVLGLIEQAYKDIL